MATVSNKSNKFNMGKRKIKSIIRKLKYKTTILNQIQNKIKNNQIEQKTGM